MRNVFLIIKHEISTTLRKRSFWLTTFLLPLVILAASLGSQALARSSIASGGDNPLLAGLISAPKPIGYVDLAGVVKQIPGTLSGSTPWKVEPLQAYPDEAAAQAALE